MVQRTSISRVPKYFALPITVRSDFINVSYLHIMRLLVVVGSIFSVVFIVWIISVVSSPGAQSVRPEVEESGGVVDLSEVPDVGGEGTGIDSEQTVVSDFAELQLAQRGVESWTMRTFSDTKGVVPLDIGLSALDVTVPADLLPLLEQSVWSVNRCFISADEPHYALQLHVRLLPDYRGNLYRDLLNDLQRWQPTMLRDVQSVVFPEEVALGGEPQYVGSGFSLADANLSDGVRFSSVFLPQSARATEIAYVIQGDDIVIGTNLECVTKISEDLLGPG
jgi:hypothetical protein